MTSLEKALDILCSFNEERGDLSTTKLSEILGYNRTTVYRLLCVLEQRGMVSKNPETKAYSLGLKIRELAALDLWYGELRHKAMPFLKQLRDITGETAGLYVLSTHYEIICVERAESLSDLRRAAHVGSVLPFGGATSKVLLLSFLEKGEPELQQIYDSLPVQNRIVDYPSLLRELRQLQKEGYCFSGGKVLPGTIGLSTPIRRQGSIIAALTVSGPSNRFDREAVRKFAPLIVDTARQLSERLGPASP
ncbi:MAG: IclR family transcriptional regulator [Candidatus Tectomicrobia bacterium]|uniref:IclR family transcriptional regulator n=1 Tax=Tectimicrobiota bacterium TaxID=2528274 RepID=A0A932M259_UNCTE|nr:IclR family transcriptional regulator [Candidatus Tectomicrobia bacterium]